MADASGNIDSLAETGDERAIEEAAAASSPRRRYWWSSSRSAPLGALYELPAGGLDRAERAAGEVQAWVSQ